MSVATQKRARRAILETDLHSRLIAELRNVAAGRSTFFFTSPEYNQCDLPRHMLPVGTADLLAMAVEALRLREELGEPSEGTVGAILQDALRRANDTSNHNRLGPIRLAQELLTRLVHDGP